MLYKQNSHYLFTNDIAGHVDEKDANKKGAR